MGQVVKQPLRPPRRRSNAARARATSSAGGRPRASRGTTAPNAAVVGEDLDVVEAVPAGARRARAGSRATSATPSPGSARSAQPRVGSRQSQTCTPTKRPTSRSMSSCERRRCSRGARRRTGCRAPASPTSSISSTASGIVDDDRPLLAAVALVRLERDPQAEPARPRGRQRRAGRRRRSRAPRRDRGRAPVPVRQTSPVGRNGARRCSEAQIRVDALAPDRRARRAAAAAGSTGTAGTADRRLEPGRRRAARAPPRRRPSGELHLPDADPVEAGCRVRRARRRRSSRRASSSGRPRTGRGESGGHAAGLNPLTRLTSDQVRGDG